VTKVLPSKEDLLSYLFDLSNERKYCHLLDLSGVQDSLSFRARSRALALANFLLDDHGKWDLKNLESALFALKQTGYIYYSRGENDSFLLQHQLLLLQKLQEEEFLRKEIERLHLPLCHSFAEDLVRSSLWLDMSIPLTDLHVKKAVLSACLTPLRQSVGSCFATAPAIFIQREQTENLLGDLKALLKTGILKRIIAGREFSVPLSPSLGWGDLKKKVFLKNLDHFFSSPSFKKALSSAHLLESMTILREKAVAIFEETECLSVQELLERMLLSFFSLTQKQVELFEQEERRTAKQGSILSPIKNAEKCIQYKQAQKLLEDRWKSEVAHPLLNAWEFTLASLSEAKMEFSGWNIYHSLGLHPKEEGGIGQIVLQFVEEKIEESNQTLEQLQRDYEASHERVRITEARLQRADSDSSARSLQAQLQSYAQECQVCLDVRDRFYQKATQYTSFHQRFLTWLDERFPQYFQEVYDPKMIDVDASQYDDSPAGFRLVYKHGRNRGPDRFFHLDRRRYPC